MKQTLPEGQVAIQTAPNSVPKAAAHAGLSSALITAGALASGFIVNAQLAGATDSWPHFLQWASHSWVGYLVAQLLAPTYRAWDAARKVSAMQNS